MRIRLLIIFQPDLLTRWLQGGAWASRRRLETVVQGGDWFTFKYRLNKNANKTREIKREISKKEVRY